MFRPADRGYCLVTYRPEQLCAAALAAIDVTITLTAPAVPGPRGTGASATATIRNTGGPERAFVVGARRTPHTRHRRKYALTPLPPDRRFDFRRADGSVIATADDVASFTRLLGSVDANVLGHHLDRGDFSRWITGTLHDRQLGAVAAAIERDVIGHRATDLMRARARLLDELEARYLSGS
jgi:hypothetical protein